MTCKTCEERRQMIASAYKGGGIKAAVRVVPAVVKHAIRNRPAIVRSNRNG